MKPFILWLPRLQGHVTVVDNKSYYSTVYTHLFNATMCSIFNLVGPLMIFSCSSNSTASVCTPSGNRGRNISMFLLRVLSKSDRTASFLPEKWISIQFLKSMCYLTLTRVKFLRCCKNIIHIETSFPNNHYFKIQRK